MWMAAELGVPFELQSFDLTDEAHEKFPSPMKKHPYFVDSDGTSLFESIAINLYLLRQYGATSPLAPRNADEEARLLQWLVYVIKRAI